jgi:hypothetical protein
LVEKDTHTGGITVLYGLNLKSNLLFLQLVPRNGLGKLVSAVLLQRVREELIGRVKGELHMASCVGSFQCTEKLGTVVKRKSPAVTFPLKNKGAARPNGQTFFGQPCPRAARGIAARPFDGAKNERL